MNNKIFIWIIAMILISSIVLATNDIIFYDNMEGTINSTYYPVRTNLVYNST